jgi:hypothetical protein
MSLDMTIDEVVTELAMASSFYMNLIVEGGDDYKFFTSCIEGVEHVNLMCAWGSENVTKIIEKVDTATHAGTIKPTLGIIDRDYRIPLKNLPGSMNLVYTDFRDLECMMLESRSFANILAELASKDKLNNFGGVNKAKKAIISAAEVIGRVRYYSQAEKINVSFKKLEIDSIICKKTLEIKHGDLIVHLNARQGIDGCAIKQTNYQVFLDAVSKAQCGAGNKYFVNSMLLCRGHDLMEIIAIALRSLLATMQSKESTGEKIEQRFRLSYPAYFKNSGLANEIMSWLARNGPIKNVSIV